MKPYLLMLLAGLSLPLQASPPAFTPAASQERGRSAPPPAQADSQQLLPGLTTDERRRLVRRVLEEYLGSPRADVDQAFAQRALPPGLQQKLARGGSLPPGWQRKLARGETMPVDLYRQGVRLPDDWGRQSGYGRRDVELILLGDKVVRVLQGQGTILDVIDITQAVLQ